MKRKVAPSLRQRKYVTGLELGSYFGLTARRIEQLAKAGVIPRAARGKYDLVLCSQRYICSIKAWRAAATIPASPHDLAALFDVSLDEVRRLSIAGVFPKLGRGRFDLAVCVKRYVQHLRANGQLALCFEGDDRG